MVARSVLPATSRATFASASSNEEAAPPLRSVASFEKSNRLLNSLPVFPKSKSEMEMGEGGEIDLRRGGGFLFFWFSLVFSGFLLVFFWFSFVFSGFSFVFSGFSFVFFCFLRVFLQF